MYVSKILIVIGIVTRFLRGSPACSFLFNAVCRHLYHEDCRGGLNTTYKSWSSNEKEFMIPVFLVLQYTSRTGHHPINSMIICNNYVWLWSGTQIFNNRFSQRIAYQCNCRIASSTDISVSLQVSYNCNLMTTSTLSSVITWVIAHEEAKKTQMRIPFGNALVY